MMLAFLLWSRARLVTSRAVSMTFEVITMSRARSTPASKRVLSCFGVIHPVPRHEGDHQRPGNPFRSARTAERSPGGDRPGGCPSGRGRRRLYDLSFRWRACGILPVDANGRTLEE